MAERTEAQRAYLSTFSGRWRLIAALLVLGMLTGAVAAQEPESEDLSLADRVEVIEVGLLAEFPDLKRRGVGTLTAEDLILTEDGKVRAVTRLAPLVAGEGGEEPWQILVFFDGALSQRDTLKRAALGLGQRSRELTGLGPVRVVVAAPGSREVLASTRSPARVEDALGAVAINAVGGDALATIRAELPAEDQRAADPATEALLRRELAVVRQRADILLVEAASTCTFPPCLLILVSDGFVLDPSAHYPAATVEAVRAAGVPMPSEISEEVGRVLAGTGWTVVGAPLRKLKPEKGATRGGAGTDYDAYKRDAGGVQMPSKDPDSGRLGAYSPAAMDVFVLPRYQPLREWAAASAGGMARVVEQLDGELARLSDRWWVFFRSERSLAGGLRQIALTFSEDSPFQQKRSASETLGFSSEEEPIRAPLWGRSSVPAELDAARARRLGSRAWLTGDFEPTVRWNDDRSRVSLSWPSDDSVVTVRLTTLSGTRANSTLQQGVEVLETDAGKVTAELAADGVRLVVLQELSSRRWAPISFESKR